jgi:hypothetical protein
LQAGQLARVDSMEVNKMSYDEKAKARIDKYRQTEAGEQATKDRMTIMMKQADKDALQAVSDLTGESKAAVVRRLIWEEYGQLHKPVEAP